MEFYHDLFLYVPYLSALVTYIVCYYMLREAKIFAVHAEQVTDSDNAFMNSAALTAWKRRIVFIHVYRKKPVKEKNNDEEDPFLLMNV
ncbi:hypothetical protein FZC66_04945 [Priestia megaterium]|nr:hypothetical protein FZC66_04945 [Priestia megaterium]